MISRRDTHAIARALVGIILKRQYGQVELDIRFVKNTQRRILKEGFRKLLDHSGSGWYSNPKITLHVRHEWRKLPVHRLIGFIAHELGHAKQILKGELRQDEKGVITYLDQQYWFFYNVSVRGWTLCPKGTYLNMWRGAPWEVALRDLGTYGEFMELQTKYERKLYGYSVVDKVVPNVA